MNGHAHELTPPGVPPAAICPSIEVLVHRRATELIAERPRRRVAAWSSVGGVAVAALCAVLVLVIGSPSGNGLLSPRQAVAAVVESLNGDGVLHWVRRADVTGAPDPSTPSATVEQTWTDLASGDSHTIRTGQQGSARTSWVEDGREWSALPDTADGSPRVRPLPRSTDTSLVSVVDEMRMLLDRADRGQAEITSAGERNGAPLVVVTDRTERSTRRVWITRDATPELVRVETTVVSPNASEPIVSTSTTEIWQVLPRTPEALADVEIPTNAKRIP